MCMYHEDHIEDMEDDYDMDEPADDMGDEHQERGIRDSDSEDEEYGQSVCPLFCIVASLHAFGIKSMQHCF